MILHDFQGVDFLGLMPCPLKLPFETAFTSFMEKRHWENAPPLECIIESNANHQLNFFAQIQGCTEVDELPSIMMAPGFNYFFHRSFMERFKNNGYFTAVGSCGFHPALKQIGLDDPEYHYTIISFNPTVMIVDRTNHPELPVPSCWSDLLRPEYRRAVAIRGHQDKSFCEGILFNMYKEHGEAGILELGKAVKAGLHPSQMVKLAGSGKSDAPVISALPYSFARLVRTNERVSLVWPEDGAIVNPFVLLVKTDLKPGLAEIARFIAGAEIGQVFASAFFPSSHPQVENSLPPQATFKWLGWDFIKNNDLGQLKPRLDQLFLSTYGEETL